MASTTIEQIREEIEGLKKAGTYKVAPVLASAMGPVVKLADGKEVINLCSNNYLGLANHPEVLRGAKEALDKFGNGTASVRFICGTFTIHQELEKTIAEFLSTERATTYVSCWNANEALVPTLLGESDAVISDELNHASIIDGCRLSQGEVRRFRHNDMADLERVLKDTPPEAGKLIIVDGLFSMEGDIAPLPEIIALARKYDARVMVDDAHAIGVLGEEGRGTAEHFHVEGEIDLIMGTYSKTLATIGGFIAGPERVINYVKHFARSLIFSAAIAPPLAAAASAALDVILEEPELRERLWKNTRKMLKGFKELGFDTGESCTPVIPIIIGDQWKTFQMCGLLQEYGVFVNPVVPPATPPGRELLRTSFMATHTEEQLDRVLEAFERAGKELGII